MTYWPWLAGGAALGYAARRRRGERTSRGGPMRPGRDLYSFWEPPRVLPSPRYSSLVIAHVIECKETR